MARQGFSKASRLLSPSQYSKVFQKADYKAVNFGFAYARQQINSFSTPWYCCC